MAKKQKPHFKKEKLKKNIPLPPPPLKKTDAGGGKHKERNVLEKKHKEKHAEEKEHKERKSMKQKNKEKHALEKNHKEKEAMKQERESIAKHDSLTPGGEGVFLETNIDKLCDIVEKKGKLGVKEASQIFKVPEDKIEEWGKHLEEHDIIEMVYPTFGKPLLKKGKNSYKETDKKHKKESSE